MLAISYQIIKKNRKILMVKIILLGLTPLTGDRRDTNYLLCYKNNTEVSVF
jgi:hypothetical protein